MKLNELFDCGAPPNVVHYRLNQIFDVVTTEDRPERTLCRHSFVCGDESRARLTVNYGWRSGRWWYEVMAKKNPSESTIRRTPNQTIAKKQRHQQD